jgi:hypothetical protein
MAVAMAVIMTCMLVVAVAVLVCCLVFAVRV